jgi:hypothetical protein
LPSKHGNGCGEVRSDNYFHITSPLPLPACATSIHMGCLRQDLKKWHGPLEKDRDNTKDGHKYLSSQANFKVVSCFPDKFCLTCAGPARAEETTNSLGFPTRSITDQHPCRHFTTTVSEMGLPSSHIKTLDMYCYDSLLSRLIQFIYSYY